jgi:HEAT repeat protein
MAVRPRQGTPDQPNSPDNAQQIAFPGLLDEVPQPEQPSGPRSGETPPPLPPPTTPDQVRFPGLIDLTGPGTETPPPSLSYLQLMERALIQARDAASAEARQQALTDLVFFANQFQEVSAGSRTNIAFVSPEKTALATRIVAQLPSAQSSGEKGAYLQALGSLQDPVTMEGLVSFLNGEADPALRQQTVGILGNLGRRGAYEPLRRVLFDASQPLPLRESVVQALIRLDDRATLLTLAQGQDVPETLRTLGVAALGELRMDAPEERAALLTALAEAPAGSALKAAAIRSLGQMADPDDAEILTALTAAAPDDETPAVKLAVLSAFEFLDYTEAVRQCVARLRQDGNYDVSRAAAQLISRRANG